MPSSFEQLLLSTRDFDYASEFWKSVIVRGDHFIWQGKYRKEKYPIVDKNSVLVQHFQTRSANRIAWELGGRGAPLVTQKIRKTCAAMGCVNPLHMAEFEDETKRILPQKACP